jgi:limonene 1,2-monooxygenase
MARYVHPHFQRNANGLRQFSYDEAAAKYATAGQQMKDAVLAATAKYEAEKAEAKG